MVRIIWLLFFEIKPKAPHKLIWGDVSENSGVISALEQ